MKFMVPFIPYFGPLSGRQNKITIKELETMGHTFSRTGTIVLTNNNGNTTGIFIYIYIWVFPEMGVPQNGWFKRENPIKTDDLGVPLFQETTIYIYIHTCSGIWGDIYWDHMALVIQHSQTETHEIFIGKSSLDCLYMGHVSHVSFVGYKW